MSRIGDIVDVAIDGVGIAIILGITPALLLLPYKSKINVTHNALNLNPPVYRDVNADGINDKIIQRVLYGIDINGKRIYLPKEQFNELNK